MQYIEGVAQAATTQGAKSIGRMAGFAGQQGDAALKRGEVVLKPASIYHIA